MSHLHPQPPSVTHSTTRLTHAEAHTFLSDFLTQADTHPAYRPDSTLTPHGPVSTSTGSATNLTLTHLRRVLAGMAGQRVGGSTTLRDTKGDQDEEDAEFSSSRPAKRPRREIEVDADGETVLGGDDRHEGAWQEKDDFELEQDDVLAPLADASEEQPYVGEASGEVVAPEEAELDVVVGDDDGHRPTTKETDKVIDKEQRKQAKKARESERKKMREAAKRA